MQQTEYIVKDAVAIQPLFRKPVVIVGCIPDTEDGVWITPTKFSEQGQYAYRLRDLDERIL